MDIGLNEGMALEIDVTGERRGLLRKVGIATVGDFIVRGQCEEGATLKGKDHAEQGVS